MTFVEFICFLGCVGQWQKRFRFIDSSCLSESGVHLPSGGPSACVSAIGNVGKNSEILPFGRMFRTSGLLGALNQGYMEYQDLSRILLTDNYLELGEYYLFHKTKQG